MKKRKENEKSFTSKKTSMFQNAGGNADMFGVKSGMTHLKLLTKMLLNGNKLTGILRYGSSESRAYIVTVTGRCENASILSKLTLACRNVNTFDRISQQSILRE